MTVNPGDDMPPIGLKSFWRVIGEPALDLAVDGNTVVVINRNQFAQTERASKRAGFVRNALHQTAITQERTQVW